MGICLEIPTKTEKIRLPDGLSVAGVKMAISQGELYK